MLEYTEYIHSLDEDAASLVMGYRLRAQEQVGIVTEGMTDGKPALFYRDQPLMSLVETKDGYSFMPFSSGAVSSASSLLDGFKPAKGEVTFTAEKQLPVDAFDKMLRERKAEIDGALGAASSGGGGGGRGV
jgi:hypothetical protein